MSDLGKKLKVGYPPAAPALPLLLACYSFALLLLLPCSLASRNGSDSVITPISARFSMVLCLSIRLQVLAADVDLWQESASAVGLPFTVISHGHG